MNVREAFPRDGDDSAQPKIDLQDVKARTSIVALVSRDVALTKLGGDHWACCPIHAEKTPSFKISEDRRAFHCFGCGASGDVFDYLYRVHNMELPEALEYLAIEAGISPDREGRKRPTRQPQAPPVTHNDDKERTEKARDIWKASQSASGTPVESYLQQRGITIPVPASIRYNPAIWYAPSGLSLPCMVAAVQAPDRRIVAVHRTYIRLDGRGKAGVVTPKMALGPLGAGAVRLGPANAALGIAEGIETGLSAMQLFGLPVWCAQGSRLHRIALPEEVRRVIIYADSGEAGMETADKALKTFSGQGRKTEICVPDLGDFNDVLNRGKAA
ncbi:MAG: CHC2 zinc finger domain-containing protein [Hyphomicrobium sp.]